jgi:hypothetical protein
MVVLDDKVAAELAAATSAQTQRTVRLPQLGQLRSTCHASPQKRLRATHAGIDIRC